MEQDIQNPKKALNRAWSADFSCSFHMACHKIVLPSYHNKLSQCFFRKNTKFISKILIKSLPLGAYDPDFDSRCCSKQFKLTYFSNLSGKYMLFNYHQHFTSKNVFFCMFLQKNV